MFTFSDLPLAKRPHPLPLHPTPWWLRVVGYPRWRMVSEWLQRTRGKRWVYITTTEYRSLFGRAP